MKKVIHSGLYRIEILTQHECSADDTFMEFRSPDSAFRFLCGFTLDHFNMAILRSILDDEFYGTDFHRLTDHQICQQVAYQIACGHVRLVRIEEAIMRFTGVMRSREVAEETSGPTVNYYVSEEPTEQVESEPSLVPESMAAAQAATLSEAAGAGAPFCEA